MLVLSLRSPFRSSWSRLRASFQVVVVEAAGALLCLVLTLRPLREKPKEEKPVKFVYYIGAGGCRAAGDVGVHR